VEPREEEGEEEEEGECKFVQNKANPLDVGGLQHIIAVNNLFRCIPNTTANI
jgi:hypothetical protein